jgi:hypothetical protein
MILNILSAALTLILIILSAVFSVYFLAHNGLLELIAASVGVFYVLTFLNNSLVRVLPKSPHVDPAETLIQIILAGV